MVDIQSAATEIRRGKEKIERNHRATIIIIIVAEKFFLRRHA